MEKTIYINYFDGIDPHRIRAIMGILTDLIHQHNPDTLYFMMSSQGGDVDSGIVLYNFLRSIKAKVITHNTGMIDSIANVVFMAGDERLACPHSTFLFHGVRMDFNGVASFTLGQLKEITDRIEKSHEKIAQIICSNSQMEKKAIEDLFLTGENKGTDFALKKGVIHDVKPVQVPDGALIVTININ